MNQKEDKYYTQKSFDKEQVPVYGKDGITVIATRVSQSFSFTIHQSVYDTLSVEEKEKYIEVNSEN